MAATEHKRAIGRRLRLARETQNPGLRSFCRTHGLDPTKVNHWEMGKHYPDPIYILMLWDNYGITADWVYLGRINGLPYELGVNLRLAEEKALAADPAKRAR